MHRKFIICTQTLKTSSIIHDAVFIKEIYMHHGTYAFHISTHRISEKPTLKGREKKLNLKPGGKK